MRRIIKVELKNIADKILRCALTKLFYAFLNDIAVVCDSDYNKI